MTSGKQMIGTRKAKEDDDNKGKKTENKYG
jgi:hypothetical protein